jgi:hypothetical protein
MTTRYQTALAFARRESASYHNARTQGTSYWLHGNLIALRILPNVVRFNWCSWYTPTTAAHMNDILRALGVNMRVSYTQARDGRADSVFDITVTR